MIETVHPSARLLAIDDEEANLRLIDVTLRSAGYRHVRCSSRPDASVDEFLAYGPDLVILDLNMPGIDGFGVLELLRPHLTGEIYLPILVVTGDSSVTVRRRALAGGAKDFIAKPYDGTELLLRIRHLLEVRFLHQALQTSS